LVAIVLTIRRHQFKPFESEGKHRLEVWTIVFIVMTTTPFSYPDKLGDVKSGLIPESCHGNTINFFVAGPPEIKLDNLCAQENDVFKVWDGKFDHTQTSVLKVAVRSRLIFRIPKHLRNRYRATGNHRINQKTKIRNSASYHRRWLLRKMVRFTTTEDVLLPNVDHSLNVMTMTCHTADASET
ncbi:hypothetical protein CSKR_110853, partial [Clonorchis sinensis]